MTGIYSKDNILDEFVEKAYCELVKKGFIPIPESFSEISYGVSFKVNSYGKKPETVAIYHSEKKGFSVVTKNQDIRIVIMSLLNPADTAGSDEAGKGDIFGPLVIACFYLCEKNKDLLGLRIKDSKDVGNSEIMAFYEQMAKKYSDYFAIVKIMPERYNSLYAEFSAKGKNLNHIMAWAHGKAISTLSTRHKEMKTVIVDRFSENREIIGTIEKMSPGVVMDFQTKGEKNTAVAIASMIARAEYLISLKKISSEILGDRITLISGSGAQSDEIISNIRRDFGQDIFHKVAKTHFANFLRS